jgi:hypothetical protein
LKSLILQYKDEEALKVFNDSKWKKSMIK